MANKAHAVLTVLFANAMHALLTPARLTSSSSHACFTVRGSSTGPAFIYQDIDRSILEPLGDLSTPSVSDIFVAMLGEADG